MTMTSTEGLAQSGLRFSVAIELPNLSHPSYLTS